MSMKRKVSWRHMAAYAASASFVFAMVGCATTGGGGASNPLVGSWSLTVESALGTSEQTLTVNADMSGAVTTTEPAATMPISNAAVDGQSATFDIVFNIQGQELAAKFEGTIDGDSISGEYVTDLGNGTVTGTRK